MTVKTILPIGAKVRILEEDSFIRGAGLKVGDIAAVHKVASKVDGQTHLVITETGNTVWVWDTQIEEVKELPTRTAFNCNVSSKDYLEVKELTSMKEITFIEIVQMIAEGKVPEGAVFYTEIEAGSSGKIEAKMVQGALNWASGDKTAVQLQDTVINDNWWIEVPEVELTWQEAFAELAAGNKVKTENWGTTHILSPTEDFDDLWEDSPFSDLDDLLNHTKYFKVFLQ